jgi:hypothetical protein
VGGSAVVADEEITTANEGHEFRDAKPARDGEHGGAGRRVPKDALGKQYVLRAAENDYRRVEAVREKSRQLAK